MHLGNFRLWHSQIVCWGFFVLFSAFAAIGFYVGREPNKSYTESQRRELLVGGAVSACAAIFFSILAWRAKIRRDHDTVA